MSYGGYQDWKRWAPADFGNCSRSEAVYFAAELRQCEVPVGAGVRIVEIGFGNGMFAGWA